MVVSSDSCEQMGRGERVRTRAVPAAAPHVHWMEWNAAGCHWRLLPGEGAFPTLRPLPRSWPEPCPQPCPEACRGAPGASRAGSPRGEAPAKTTLRPCRDESREKRHYCPMIEDDGCSGCGPTVPTPHLCVCRAFINSARAERIRASLALRQGREHAWVGTPCRRCFQTE